MPPPPIPPPVRVAPLPYASPAGFAGDRPPEAIWQEGNALAAAVYPGGFVRLPDRCVKCNAPTADLRPWRRDLYWHHPAYYVLILPGVLIYALVAMAVRKKVTISGGLCDEHRKRRAKNIALAWGIALLGVASIVAAIYCANDSSFRHGSLPAVFGIAAPVLILAGAVVGIILAPILKVRRISDRVTWFTGAGPAFLESLPSH